MQRPPRMNVCRLCAAAVCVVLSACAVAPRPVQGPAPDESARPRAAASQGFSQALRKAMPFVVGVYGMGGRPAAVDWAPDMSGQGAAPRGRERAPWSSPLEPVTIGAGFFIDGDGTLVTAAHVVADASRVLVKLADQQVLVAELVDLDDDFDIAVLRVHHLAAQVPAFGRSAASRPGDWVLAVGEPFGLQRSVVAGIVAGRMRHFAEDGDGLYIQSDLALNPGNSGGPLLNGAGDVIGMNLRTVVGPYGTAGVSLSVPIETVIQIAAELRGGQADARPRLGVGFEDVSPPAALEAGRAYAAGAYINRVTDGGLGQRLGLRVGDIVTGFNGHAIDDSADLARRLLAWRSVPGTRIVVWRERAFLGLAAY
jgi:serine protease Do